MRVFVTGASGFVGRHLLSRLLIEGHNIIAYDLKPFIYPKYTCGHTHIITGNLSSGEGLDQIAWEEVDVVVHLAAAGVKASQRTWSECISVNILGTEHLIHAISRVTTPPLLVYPRTFYEDYLSETLGLKNNPYIVTKRAATKVVELWAKNNKNARVVFGTVFQAYGAGDDPGNVLTYTVKCLKDGILAKLGSGEGLRDWIYIDDLVDAFMRSFCVARNNIQYFDFGTGKLTSMKEVVKILAKILDKPVSLLNFDSELDRGDVELKAKATNFVPGWEPFFTMKEGLTQLINNLG